MKKTLLALSCVAGLFAGTSCGKKEDEKAAGPPPATPVTLVEAKATDAVYYDEYPATVMAINNVELRSQVAGFITGIYFKEGDVVQKGKKLYEIDRRKYQAAYQQALAGLRSTQALVQNAQVNLNRYERLLEQDAVARQIVDNARTNYATAQAQVGVAQANVAAARTDLDYSLINAPFTGRIGISQVRLGSQVSPGTTLLNTISGEDPMGVDFVVTAADLNRFISLQRQSPSPSDSTFRLVLPDGTPYGLVGKILAIDRGVDQQTGTVQIRVQFANPQRQLKDGMSTVLRVLNRQSGRRVVVPYKAVVEQMGENFIFVAGDSSKAYQHKVQLGPRLRDQIVVMEGIKAGDQVVTEGLQRLRDGGKIQVGTPAQAAAQSGAAK
ncbi:efflux RND transporter periplasmic adaptor subunit [Hymenobacter taeanensis]|uniref:Efflux RND transporter periplasmic adaptor subunit n=1 Tax=Hymenobacter taeanensis TaxID=2735321 RepID=A0A6M6BHG3_9BACT|nr:MULTISPECIES: efflux RND transporter periplasmic adaptor subunit [Hymenobacter]QJX47432.1 efflux RND transporter periplasmic adaptor subunit [Hymenobacter taeanensis]UOQ83086.1 efflux RND transporter periplasmic adaptor subunit [Hymenobacter sp. 5414T-23]